MNLMIGFGSEPLLVLFTGLVILVLVIVWVAGNALSSGNGGTVDRSNRVAQLYGYTVCLVALITVLFTVPGIINSTFRLTDPLHAEGSFEPNLSAFDAYKATYERGQGFSSREIGTSRPVPSDDELHRSFDALRADRIATNRHEGTQSLITDILLLGFALGLFAGHWRWLRRKAEAAAVAG